jgi:phosphate transport system substrate-binding protein
MLLADQISFAQSSRPLEDKEIQQAASRGYPLLAIPIAIDGIAIAVNPNLNLPGLTVSQLQQIYTGKITNWSQVGGSNQPITLYSRRPADSGTVEFFIQDVLNKQPLASTVQFIATTTQALRKVSTDPGGIYFASAPEVVGQCTVKSLPLGRKAGEWVTPYQLPMVPLSACPGQRDQLNREGFQTGNYPLTRRLFVIVKQNGQPDEQAGRAYAALMLTDQGQDLIAKAGYVRIR